MASKEELKQMLRAPIYLASNTYLHFYNGGKLRAEFVGESDPKDDFRSEEWIFSTNRAITPGRDNPPDKGFSRIELPSGEIVLLKELLETFPEETLGKKHAEKYGSDLGILVKIFDVGDDAHIPVHWHPSPQFASKHLNSPYGKNEAWVVIGTRPGAKAWIGWKEDIAVEDFRKWMEAQDVETMRKHMHEVTPKVGDVIFLRDSFVHSLGSGLCILEPQEPTDWNILAEWEGFPYGKEDGTLGLGWDVALQAADFTAMPLDYLNNYVKRTPELLRAENGSREDVLVPKEAKKYFWLTRLTVMNKLSMPSGRGFYCAITTQGEGKLVGPFGEKPIKRGQSVFIPASLPAYEFVNTGDKPLEVVCCYPPEITG
jgi:mannose-6-phosphate isomerase